MGFGLVFHSLKKGCLFLLWNSDYLTATRAGRRKIFSLIFAVIYEKICRVELVWGFSHVYICIFKVPIFCKLYFKAK